MSTILLLRLVGPMQSWGTRSLFDRRDTEREPSKSAIVGLLCAALGRPQSEDVADLATLAMAVRVDREGRLEKDFQTASHEKFYTVNGKRRKATVISDRFYLADAKFLVALEGPYALLESLWNAVYSPYWMLYLGRKSFVPGEPVWLPDGLLAETSIWDAISMYPWLHDPALPFGNRPETLRVVYDDLAGNMVRNDVPINFANREFRQRRVSVTYVNTPPSTEV